MTLSTDTRTQHPATRRSRRPASLRLQAYGVGIALAAALGALAFAGQSTYGPGDGPISAYARPTPALHGQTLSVYIATHQTSRLIRQR